MYDADAPHSELERFKAELPDVSVETIVVDGNPHVLSIEDAGITHLPDCIGDITTLEIINLKGNKLSRLPDAFEGMHKLRRLILSENMLGALPPLPMGLEEIYIENNELFDISWLGDMRELRVFNAQHNNITQIPVIERLQQLEILNLANNHIDKLPESIVGLQSLQYLNMTNNQIEKFPAGIINIGSIHTLLFGNNNLQQIPKGLYKLSELRDLDFSDNKALNQFNKYYQGKLQVDKFKQEYRKVEHSDGFHDCPGCNSEVPISIINCPGCDTTLNHCQICRWGFQEDRYQCPKCHELFHHGCAMKTLVFSNKCPSCKSRMNISQLNKLD